MAGEQEHSNIPELLIIEELARKLMPPGHQLKAVDLSFGSLEEGQEPRFLVIVDLLQKAGAPEPMRWADKLARFICQQWPNDPFYVKVNVIAMT